MSSSIFDKIKKEIMTDQANSSFTERGIEPLYKANEKAKIIVIGQAPGRVAEESQLMWNDLSGDRLREWMGITRQVFYENELIAQLPMDFYYPGKAKTGDAPPRKGFAEKWHPLLMEEMPYVETIILVGNYAQKHYMGKERERNLTETVRNFEKYLPDFFPLVHPSPLNQRWLKKNPWFEEDVVPLLKKVVKKALQDVSTGPKPYFVYILRCEDKSLYTGITTDINRRFKEHESGGKAGGAKYTTSRKPLYLEALWQANNRADALKLEHKIKKLSKLEKESLVKENLSPKVDLSLFSRLEIPQSLQKTNQ